MSYWYESIRPTPKSLLNAEVHEKQFCFQPYGRSELDKPLEKKRAINAAAWKKQLSNKGLDPEKSVAIYVGYKGLPVGSEVFLVPKHYAGNLYWDASFGDSKDITVVGKIVQDGRGKRVAFLPAFTASKVD